MSRVFNAVGRLRERKVRLKAFAIIGIILAVLCVFPQPYISRARIVPQDPTSPLGSALGGAGSRLQDLSALFGGGRRAIDLYLTIGQSEDIRTQVIRDLKLVGSTSTYATLDEASIRIRRQVAVQSLPGGVLQIEAKTYDADLAINLVKAFTKTIGDELRDLNADQVSNKRKLLETRFRDAAARLAQAQGALNEFRRRNRISAAPDAELGSAIAVRAGVEADLQAKQVKLANLRQILGPDNPRVAFAEADVRNLQRQLSQNSQPAANAGSANVAGLTEISTQYLDLYRDYLFAQSIYQVYARLAEEIAVEDLSGRDSPTIQVIESPHLDPGLHVNVSAAAALALLVLIVLFTDLYAPATGIDLWNKAKRSPSE